MGMVDTYCNPGYWGGRDRKIGFQASLGKDMSKNELKPKRA
jgi:hypothetical protein